MEVEKDIRYGDMLKTRCMRGLLDFARFSFSVKSGGERFIVGRHHRSICEALDNVVSGRTRRLIINIAPRYGKTELAVKAFIEYGLCLNPRSRFLHLSYSDDLVRDSSREIRETLMLPEMRSLFGVGISGKSDKKWYTDAGGGLYAVSTGGQVTGFGAGSVDAEDTDALDEFIQGRGGAFSGAIVIDDPIKPEDALSDNLREKVNQRFETTIRNRVNSRRTPIIIIMQRLHPHDLCGYLQEVEPDEWTVLSLPCIYFDDFGMEFPLWPEKHTLEELHKIERANSFVFQTQYMQNPQPLEGLMYREFKTYDVIPPCRKEEMCRCNYTDTADTGSDYLCSICYDELPDGNYVRHGRALHQEPDGVHGAGARSDARRQGHRSVLRREQQRRQGFPQECGEAHPRLRQHSHHFRRLHPDAEQAGAHIHALQRCEQHAGVPVRLGETLARVRLLGETLARVRLLHQELPEGGAQCA